MPLLVAHPTAAGAYVAEDDALRVYLADGLHETGPIVVLLFAVGTLAAGTVEPLLEERSVLCVYLS